MSKTLKFGIILLAGLCVVLLVVVLVGLPLEAGVAETTGATSSVTSDFTGDEDLIEAVNKALESASGRWETFDYQIDHIQVQRKRDHDQQERADQEEAQHHFFGPELAKCEVNEAERGLHGRMQQMR